MQRFETMTGSNSIRTTLLDLCASTLEFRHNKCAEFPDDVRNLAAVACLRSLHDELAQIGVNDFRWQRLDRDLGALTEAGDYEALFEVEQAAREYLRRVGFGARNVSVRGLLDIVAHEIAAQRAA